MNILADVTVMRVTVVPATRLLNVLSGRPNNITISMLSAIACPIAGMHAIPNRRTNAPVSLAIVRTVGVVGCISPQGNG
jgi:hypothetical protein